MTTKPRGRQQAADPADRALRAAEECRAATREAHEAIQGYKDLRAAAADLRAAIAEARVFLAGEVKRQLDAAGPATEAALAAKVEEVTAYFEQLLAKAANAKQGRKDPAGQVLAMRRGVKCPYCGTVNDNRLGISTADDRPHAAAAPRRGSKSLCVTCREVSIYDADDADDAATGALFLREPTLSEAKAIAKSPLIKKAITAMEMADEDMVALRADEQASGPLPWLHPPVGDEG
jgi:hypothetical protein